MEEGSPSPAKWELPPELREMLAQHRNPVPKEEDLKGDLNRVIPLGMKFISGRNEWDIGVAIPGVPDAVIPPQHEAKCNDDDEIFLIPFPPPRPIPLPVKK